MSTLTPEDRPSSVTLEIVVASQPHDWLIEVQDEDGARQVPLTESRIVVGTSRGADVVIHDPTVSSRHCALSTLGSGIAIEDLGSTNGTFVGTARVREAWGAAGTIVTLGNSTLVFRVVQAPDDQRDDFGPPLSGVAGASVAMRRLAAQVRRLARHSQPVLIFGETGSGKELIARALHREGPRESKPFVVVNMGTLPRELIETELFGHERGAFTGAIARRAGAFRDAEGGTLFLDEIGELPLEAQPKLLRALDGYEVRAVGASGSGSRANVRVIAATHQRLEQLVTERLFRRDLFHRLEAFVLELPPMRARRGDIASIARAVLDHLEPDFGRRRLTPGAIARLAAHEWPGNVRELRNVLLRACDLGEEALDVREIDLSLRIDAVDESVRAISPALAKALLREHNGNLSAAARAAGCPRTTFRKLLGAD
jgi:DNA-binding NtrC family response regulator